MRAHAMPTVEDDDTGLGSLLDGPRIYERKRDRRETVEVPRLTMAELVDADPEGVYTRAAEAA